MLCTHWAFLSRISSSLWTNSTKTCWTKGQKLGCTKKKSESHLLWSWFYRTISCCWRRSSPSMWQIASICFSCSKWTSIMCNLGTHWVKVVLLKNHNIVSHLIILTLRGPICPWWTDGLWVWFAGCRFLLHLTEQVWTAQQQLLRYCNNLPVLSSRSHIEALNVA